MAGWNDYIKDAEVSKGFEMPTVPDDLYDAQIQEVSDPPTENPYKPGEMEFFISWELLSDAVPEGTTLRQYVSIPPQYVQNGYLNEKSNLHKLMEALGFDMSGRFRVDPTSWQGERARVMVENKPNKDGTELRPKITKVKPARALRKAAAPAPAARQAAPAGRRASVAGADQDDGEDARFE